MLIETNCKQTDLLFGETGSIYHGCFGEDRKIHHSGSLFGIKTCLVMPNSDPYDGFMMLNSVSQWQIFPSTSNNGKMNHREIMALFVLHKLILDIGMRSHPVGLDVWFLVRPFVFFHTSCVRTAKAVVRLSRCTGSPEPLLVAYVISTLISRAGLNVFYILRAFVERLSDFC